jgi:CubicO group peptidase (beta-lactamase class C family)
MEIPIGTTMKYLIAFMLGLPLLAACRATPEVERAKRVEALFDGLIAEDGPGAAVLVVRDGRAVVKRGWGVADLRTKRPINADTNFRLASVTKQFTAAAAMLLVREGKLRYDDRLTDLFPGFPDYGRGIAVRHLLNHTSGLPDYEDLMPTPDPSLPVEAVQISDAEVLELLKRQTAGKFPPGSRWAYSNSGYVLLGLVVERASDRPFSEFLRERVFLSLGMTGSVVYELGKNEVGNRAYGHSRDDGAWVEKDQSPTSATRGDGRVYSSLADLAKWDEALRRHTLLAEDEMKPALTPVRVEGAAPTGPDGSPADYGFGWFLDPWRGRARMWHYGETSGFGTALHRFVDHGLTVVVLCNRDDLDASALALKTSETYLEGEQP